MQQLIVVLPTYNEAENLPRMVAALLGLSLRDTQLSVLVVDDNSPDGTGQLADGLAREHSSRVSVVHRPRKEGLGKAYVDGFTRALAAGAELVLQMDCDFSHQPKYIQPMLDALPGADVVLGSRYTAGGSTDEKWPWWRKLLSWFANSVYVRATLGVPVADATGGFRLWKRRTLIGMDFANRLRSSGYVFQVELAYVASRLGYVAKEVPILFPDRDRGTSKMNLKIQLEAASRVFDVRARHRKLTPKDRSAGG
ncbi:MAG TPA: polyprenol monophosphomannose synthase [Planctomycetota bacterium]|nr:polyprenol monophosphomannose synthase [Planctomycetota bacterium]